MTSEIYNKLRKIAEGGRRPMLPYPGIDFVGQPVGSRNVTSRAYDSDHQPQRAQKPTTTQQLDESDNPMYWSKELQQLITPKQVQQPSRKPRPREIAEIYLPDSEEPKPTPNKPKPVKKFTIPKPGEAPDWYRGGE